MISGKRRMDADIKAKHHHIKCGRWEKLGDE
jgi:hypothetical protein